MLLSPSLVSLFRSSHFFASHVSISIEYNCPLLHLSPSIFTKSMLTVNVSGKNNFPLPTAVSHARNIVLCSELSRKTVNTDAKLNQQLSHSCWWSNILRYSFTVIFSLCDTRHHESLSHSISSECTVFLFFIYFFSSSTYLCVRWAATLLTHLFTQSDHLHFICLRANM